jgi:hypothetical protein
MADLPGPALETALRTVQRRVAPRTLEHARGLLLQAPDLLGDRV